VECDVTSRERVREFLAVARQQNGPVDVLVNNAGVIRVGPVETMREEDYQYAMQTHFWGPLHFIEEVVPEMKARGAGRIVNVASVGGKIGVPHLIPYCASKFALVGLSQGLRAELAQHGIVVTTICPGLMRTGSPVNAEFKGQHEDEFAWFTLGDSLPGASMSAESAARKILDAAARGDAEVVLSLPAKLAVAAQAVAPNLTSALKALANKYVMPGPGGIGTAVAKGRDSRGKLPDVATVLTDRAAERNNEAGANPVPPPITVARK
jgi:NAD(P)-dependent dehydrogenase (short-subunit alcohol dehydrogenase family)